MESFQQQRLDFGESDEAAKAAEKAFRASRARDFESAAERIGMLKGETGYKLAGLLAVYVDSPSMRSRGLTGLRWEGTKAELAADPRINGSVSAVSRALARFREAGMIETYDRHNRRGQVDGIGIVLNLNVIRDGIQFAKNPSVQNASIVLASSGSPKCAQIEPVIMHATPDATPGDMAGDMADATPLATPLATPGDRGSVCDSLYSSVIPSFPNTSEETTTTEEREPSTMSKSPSPSIARPTDPWTVVVVLLSELGIDQAARAVERARARGRTPEQVKEQIENLTRSTRDPGTIYHQVCNPRASSGQQLALIRVAKPRPPDRETLRTRAYLWLRSQLGRVPNENEVEELVDRQISATKSEDKE